MLISKSFVADYLKATREQKVATEVSVAKREKDFYLTRVDKAKAKKAQEQRRIKVCLIYPSRNYSTCASVSGAGV